VSSFLNLALKYLEIPATSTASEKGVSKVGEIVSRLMVNLKPSTVDMLVCSSKKICQLSTSNE
jgi:hAT family C-terminal dimerisation region